MLPIDRTAKSTLDNNLVNGNTSDAPAVKNSNDVVYNTIDELNNKVNALVASGALSPYPPAQYNKLINGNFDVWQRGLSFTLGSAGGYTADRWKFVRSGAGTTTITQDTSVPNGKSKFALNCNGSYLAGEFEDKKYHIESLDAAKFSGQQVTISAQHKDTVSAGSNTLQILVHYGSAVDNFATVEAVGFSAQLPLTASFSLASLTLTLPATSPISGYPIGNGIQIVFRHIQAGATGSLITVLSQVQMCAGSVSLAFQPRNIVEELALCQRYYQKSFDYGVAPAQASGNYNGALFYRARVAGAATDGVQVTYPAIMRVVPTLTFYSPASANNTWRRISGTVGDASAPAIQNTGQKGFNVENTQGSGDATGSAYAVHYSADAEI